MHMDIKRKLNYILTLSVKKIWIPIKATVLYFGGLILQYWHYQHKPVRLYIQQKNH